MNDSLLAPYSEKDISDALFQIGPMKSPVKVVQLFFTTGLMPEGVNDTSIVLIPKVQHPSSLKDFRPISFCNVCVICWG